MLPLKIHFSILHISNKTSICINMQPHQFITSLNVSWFFFTYVSPSGVVLNQKCTSEFSWKLLKNTQARTPHQTYWIKRGEWRVHFVMVLRWFWSADLWLRAKESSCLALLRGVFKKWLVEWTLFNNVLNSSTHLRPNVRPLSVQHPSFFLYVPVSIAPSCPCLSLLSYIVIIVL